MKIYGFVHFCVNLLNFNEIYGLKKDLAGLLKENLKDNIHVLKDD